jgi:hypothetical protein
MFSLLKNKKSTSMYEQIVSWDNICQAYLDLYCNFTEKCQNQRYKGSDGTTLHVIEPDAETLLHEVQKDLIEKNPLLPARYIEIPKLDGSKRGIYLLTLKDRIKCQAVYRALEPHLEKQYSDTLYSFRSSHPSYYASRAVRRFYLRNLGKEMYVYRADLSNYSDNFDRKFLFDALSNYKVEDKVVDIIQNIISQPFISDGKMISNVKGAYQGMTLCPLFSNIYIGHIDDYVSKKVDFYRRLGDDFIVFDKNLKKLKEIKTYIEEEIKKTKLILNEDKEQFGNINEVEFDYHGLQYNKGKIQLRDKKIKAFIAGWKQKLKFNNKMSNNQRINKLIELLNLNSKVQNHHFAQFLCTYLLVNDTKQIQYLSKRFFHVLTKYFTGKLTYKSINQTKKILKDFKFPSLTAIHTAYSNGKKLSYKLFY